ncbi:hypothetical protein AALP_AA8G110200 [Arabis alpina]|uniref:Protein kinase domain-containing protein n=1 Tax=Arabis alpina TaxID=50452 RepID=A0A087G6A3_ARAAL|nr:hypothetical protein AALP_AA8G110200 [Arabis alpina]
MLDEQYNAKLLYLESTQQHRFLDDFIGYIGYEIAKSGRYGMEGDVLTFGVILLELLTGLKAFDRERNVGKQILAVWTKSFLPDKIGEIIDPRLGNDYPVKAATQMGKLIKCCIEQDLKKRPLMQDVLDTLNCIAKMKH